MNLRAHAAQIRTDIYTAIFRGIRDGTLPAGSRLPTERELAVSYGAARSAVRTALAELERDGLITRQVGRGSYIADAPGVSLPRDSFSLAELAEARICFEPTLVPLVIERATEADFAGMEACLARMEAADSWSEYKESKYALHKAIIRTTRNRFLIRIFEQVIEARRPAWAQGDETLPVSAEVRTATVQTNRAIVEALRAGRADDAASRIRQYLLQIVASV